MVNAFKAIDSGAAVSAPSVDKANGSQERGGTKVENASGEVRPEAPKNQALALNESTLQP
jgi:hypothetical protein